MRLNRYLISSAIGHLAKCLEREDAEFTPERIGLELSQAQRNIEEIIGECSGTVQYTEQEAENSSDLHTFLRKYEDSVFGTVLWGMKNNSRGEGVWHAFIKELTERLENKMPAAKIAPHLIYKIQRYVDSKEIATLDDRIMLALLIEWIEKYHFKTALREVLSWRKNNE